jgi:hypothetical protein
MRSHTLYERIRIIKRKRYERQQKLRRMNMDYNKWADEMFEACIKGIKELNPQAQESEWCLVWDLMEQYKTYRQNKAESNS